MLRIGVMLDSLQTTAWVASILEEIQRSTFGRIELIILNTPPEHARPPFSKRLKNHWKLTLFHKYEAWDYARNKAANDSKASRDVAPLLADVQTLKVLPERKGFSDYITGADVEVVRAANLDVLLRFGFRIVRGGILDVARYGIWSFHHDDNFEYRGGPPLFWEVYEGNPVSGTILQILTSALDGGKVIYRGHSATNQRSLYLNRNPIYWKTAEYMLRRLKDLDELGWAYIQSLPTYTDTTPIASKIYRTPNAWQMLKFFARLFGRSVRASFSSRKQGAYDQWFLALRKRSAQHVFNDASGYKLMRPTADRFYADPFLIERDDKTYLFFEDYRYDEKRALISYCELAKDGTPSEVMEALRRPYHLSYPFVFEHAGQMYMIPETKENRTVELYRAEEFPSKWVLVKVLLENIHAVDATIHCDVGRFWMFVGLSNGKFSNCDELALFYADSLLGPWLPHRHNPVVSDVRRARPAGKLFYDGGKLIRPSQDCAKAYGYAVVFSEVTKLSEDKYEEKPVGRINPDWIARNLGTHTYSRSEKFEVIDGNFPHKPRV